MKEGFLKFKKKSVIDTAVKCGVIGFACAAFMIGVILLACKLADKNLLFCLIGIVGLGAGGVAYAFLRTSDMKLAIRLDNVLGYGQKVQTMLAYQGQSGTIIDIQRADTESKLSNASVKSLKFENLWAYITVGVLALAMFITGVALPADINKVPEPTHSVTEWEGSAFDALILYVQESDASDTLKANVVDELVALRNVISDGVPEKDLANFVKQTVTAIRNAVYYNNSLGGVSATQKQKNSELGDYVVTKLYDIFGIENPDEGSLGGNSENPGAQIPDSPTHGSGGTGQLTVGADELFFDPMLGYVSYGEALTQYNADMVRAFEEGVLSEEEWYDFLREYFNYLYGIQNGN